MNIVVDTSVWSLRFRRKTDISDSTLTILSKSLDDGDSIFLPGFILQEILQGVKKESEFTLLKNHLSAFYYVEPVREEYIEASRIYNKCRVSGIQISSVDALLASLAIQREYYLLTTDKDFQHIGKFFPLKLL